MHLETLPSAAERALRHVGSLASGPALDAALRITVNFHPDRRCAAGRPILTVLADDRVYRSQFATGTSNGSMTAHPGGDRWHWERHVFGGAYDDAAPEQRPVYGALDFRRSPFGAAPRFGSSFFRLAPGVVDFATFCYPDSSDSPVQFGTSASIDLTGPASPGYGPADPLCDYVEAHLHHPVLLDRDVEALVLDPSYRGTEVEEAARLLPFPVDWHGGFRLTVEELRRFPDYRGAEFVELGEEIAVDGHLDPRIIGLAAGSGRHHPQRVKQVWHIVAQYGSGWTRDRVPAGRGVPPEGLGHP